MLLVPTELEEKARVLQNLTRTAKKQDLSRLFSFQSLALNTDCKWKGIWK